MQRLEPVKCPYCEFAVPRPETMKVAVTEVQGGRCECGAIYVADVTGRQGGECLMDGLAVLCEGNIDEAGKLLPGQDYEYVDINYRPRTFSVAPRARGPRAFGSAKMWFLRRLEK